MDSSEISCNGSWKIGQSDNSKNTKSYNTVKNDCKPLKYCSILVSRVESVPEFFGSYVQSHDQVAGVGNCSPGTPLLLVFPMLWAKTKYQWNQEIANSRLDAKTRFLAAVKDPNRTEDISALIQASGLSKSTAYHYLAGGLTKTESNKSKGWLSPEEEEAQVDELLALAAWGFGEVGKQIAQQIEEYTRIRDNNPHFQIGKNYSVNAIMINFECTGPPPWPPYDARLSHQRF